MRRTGGWLGGIALATLAGCAGAAHLGDGTTGRAFRAAAAAQAVRPPSQACAAAVTGLDSQEAAIVSDGYRRSLAPKGAAVEEPEVLFVAPQTTGPRRALPPPSVPPGGK